MDVISEFFDQNESHLMQKLEGAGFSVNQARDFLPEAAESILRSTQNTGIAQAITGLLDDPAQLMDSINANEIVEKLKMRPERVASGFGVIIPVLSRALSQKRNGIVGSIGRGSVGDFMSSARKLFS